MPTTVAGTNYKDFLNAVSTANKSIDNYDSFTSASDASKLAGMEFRVKTYMSLYNVDADQAYTELNKTLTTGSPRRVNYPLLTNNESNKNLLIEAVDNIKNNNTLIDPTELDNCVKSFLQAEQEQHKKYETTPGYSKNDYINIYDDPACLLSKDLENAKAVEDNFYLAIASRGNQNHNRTFSESLWSRNDQSINLPYKLNANYVPQNADKTLSGGSVVRDQQGNITTINGKPVTSGAGSTAPTAPTAPGNTTTPTTSKNPYQNANGSYNTTAINNFLKAFGYDNVELPELKGFSAVDPLAGKSLSDRDLKVLEAVQNSGLKDLLTNEFYKSIVNGADYATWAEANGMTEANGFSKTAFDQAYSDAAKAKNETLSQQYKNAVNALYQALGAEDNIIAQELRKAAAQAQASRASTGMAAANQLSAALSRTQQNSDEALKIAQSGIELGKEMAENDAAAIVEALNKWTATHQKNVELKNNADSNRVQGGAAVLGYAGDVVNAETAADQTRTDSALRTNATNQSAVAAENTAKTDIYSTKKGAQSSILNSLIDGNVNQAMNNATNKTNLTIAGKNNEATMLETMAALGEKGYTFKNNKVYDKNGKVIYG